MDLRFKCPHCGSRRFERDDYSGDEHIICSRCLRRVNEADLTEHRSKAVEKIIEAFKDFRDK
uniref:ECs_2282 family putative zinc-binding protein n=1 Tax=Hafnia alvei TaxID=569 RepID=UPI003F5877F0